MIKNVRLTQFAINRHFKPGSGGTKILDVSPEDFEDRVAMDLHDFYYAEGSTVPEIVDGYAPFCKLVPVKNFTKARVGSLPIDLTTNMYKQSCYSARREGELAVLTEHLVIPKQLVPEASYLMLVLYSREQLEKEYQAEISKLGKDDLIPEFDFENDPNAEWGIVAVLGQSHPNEEPMKPITMMRNALGKEEGGSGVPLDREAYNKAVEFWSNNAVVKGV
jgi:hypothetical protein